MMKFARGFLGLAIFAFFGATAFLQAATITWFDPQNISGNTDVLTNGTLFQAANFATVSGSSTTVNGVLFSKIQNNGTSTVTSGNLTLTGNGTVGPGLRAYNDSVTASPFSTLSASYQALLQPSFFVYSGTAPVTAPKITLAINNLTVGQQYDIQFWVNDSRAVTDTSIRQVDVGGKLLNVNTSGTTGGLGQWLLGTFVADSATQSFDAIGLSTGTLGPTSYATAMQVRAVPEPSTIALLASGVVVVSMALRRGRRGAGAAAVIAQ